MVTSVSIDGAALASLLTDAATAPGDLDGLLFGAVHVRRTVRLTDETDVPETVEARVVGVHGHVCALGLCAIYDGAGALDEAALARLASAGDGAPVAAWFVARRATPLLPSLREAAVWRALQRRAAAAGTPPPLLVLLGGEQPDSGEPFSTQFVFLAPPQAPHMPPQALPVSIENYGSAAPPQRAADAASLLPPAWHPLLDGAGSAADAPWQALEATAQAAAAQTRCAVDAALQRVDALCCEVECADDALAAALACERARDAARLREELEDSSTLTLSDIAAAAPEDEPASPPLEEHTAPYVALPDAPPDAPPPAQSALDVLLQQLEET